MRGSILFDRSSTFPSRQFAQHGFLNVGLTDNGSKVTATFYDNRGMTDKDHIVITKENKKN